MKKFGLLVLGLAVSFALPASAQTVTVKKGHHGGYEARGAMHDHHGVDMRRRMDHERRTVVIKRGHHRRH